MALHCVYIGKHNHHAAAMTDSQPMSLASVSALVTGNSVWEMNLELNVYIILNQFLYNAW